MRTTFILNRNLPPKQVPHKRYFVGGKILNTELMLKLLKDAGIKVDEIMMTSTVPAKEFHNIKIGSTMYGLVVWAKDSSQTQELMEHLLDDGYFDHKCYMDIEKRADRKKEKENL